MSNSDEKNQSQDSGRRAKVGLWVTLAYVLALALLTPVLYNLGWLKPQPLSLNEVGDFLAGLFGPLAIFWLVLGFFQQGAELKNSVETLKLQAKELAASVEQQRELVSVTREQLAHERELLGLQHNEKRKLAQPDFIVEFRKTTGFGDNTGYYRCKLVNTGSAVSRVELLILEKGEIVVSRNWPFCEKGWENDSSDAYGRKQVPNIVSPLVATLSYVTALGENWEETYDLFPPDPEQSFDEFEAIFREIVRLP